MEGYGVRSCENAFFSIKVVSPLPSGTVLLLLFLSPDSTSMLAKVSSKHRGRNRLLLTVPQLLAGRLLFMRRLRASDILPEHRDSHSMIRKKIVSDEKLEDSSPLGALVSFEWYVYLFAPTNILINNYRMFRGVTRDGVNREVSISLLEPSTERRRVDSPDSLAIPKTALMVMAERLLSRSKGAYFPGGASSSESDKEVLVGIRAPFEHVVQLEKQSLLVDEDVPKGAELSTNKIPDLADKCGISPLDYEGFSCVQCRSELSNIYYECLCCAALHKDYNLCQGCFMKRRFNRSSRSHPDHDVFDHCEFRRHFRFRVKGQVDAILEEYLSCVGDDHVEYYSETKAELDRFAEN